MDLSTLIRFGIMWGPTIIFTLVILIHVIVGLIRGHRKSLILAIQSFILFILCFILFITLINIEEIDVLTFKVIDKILAFFGTSVSALLGAENISSLKEIFMVILPDYIGYGDVLESLFTDNGAYLNTIVSLSYNLFFAILCYLLYCFLTFIAYIIYLIFYNSKKYEKNCNRLYRNNAQSLYVSKNRLGGGIIGLLRGFVTGIVLMSFIGSLFFIVGGDGKKEMSNIKFGDEKIDTIYSAYDSLGSYANSGILSILNNMKNDEDVPYYLFAFDLVFSGKFKDDTINENTNFILRDEVGEYVKLTRNTFDLLLKYDRDNELKKYITGKSNKDINDILINIFEDDEYVKEFKLVIDDFESKTYLINLSLALVNSLIINTPSSDPYTTEFINILFKGENAIKLNQLIHSSDVKIILNMILDILNVKMVDDYAEYSLDVVRTVLPSIKRLSLYNDKDVFKQLNPLLSEFYGFVLKNSFSEIVDAKALSHGLKETKELDIDWFREFHIIVENFESLYDFYNNVYLTAFEADPNLDMMNFIFNNIGNSNENILKTRAVLNTLSDSRAISYFIEYSPIMESIILSFPQEIRENIPKSINLANKYDENGNLIEVGEMSTLFQTLLDVASNKKQKEKFLEILNFNSQTDNLDSLSNIFSAFDTKFYENVASSKLLNYAITALLNNVKITENASVFIPKSCLVIDTIDSITYKRIEKTILVDSLAKVSNLLKLVNKYFVTNISPETFDSLFKDQEVYNLVFNNKIFEGTVSNVLIDIIKNAPGVILVDSLRSADMWLENRELESIYIALLNSNIQISDLLNSNLDINMIIEWSKNQLNIENIMKSKLLLTNISYALNNVNELIIPYSSFEEDNETFNGFMFKTIKKSELIDLISLIPYVYTNNELNINYIISNIDTLISKPIINSTFTYNVGLEMVKNNNFIVPANYRETLTKESFLNNPKNPWIINNEGGNIVVALKSLFYDFDMNKLNNLTIEELESILFTIDYFNYNVPYNSPYYGRPIGYAIMASHLISLNITNIIDNNLTTDIIDSYYRDLLKENDAYKAEELINLVKVSKERLEIYSLNSINIAKFENLVFNDNYKLSLAYQESNAIKGIISTQIASALNGRVNKDLFKAIGDTFGFIYYSEIDYLLSALNVLNIKSFNDLNNFNFTDRFSINTLFGALGVLDSKILRDIITIELDNCFPKTNFLQNTYEAREYIGYNISIYKTQDLADFISAVFSLHIDLNNFNINNYNIIDFKTILNSLIIRNSLTIYLYTIGFELLISDVDNYIITLNSAYKLIDDLKALNINNFSDFSVSNIKFTYNYYLTMLSNNIINCTITKYLMNNKFYHFTNDIVESEINMYSKTVYRLNSNECYGLFLMFNGNTIDSFDINNISLSNLANSQLFINSISKALTIDNVNVRANMFNSERKTDLNGNDTYVLTFNEINNLIYALKVINNNNFIDLNFSLDLYSLMNLSKDDLITILKSNVIHNAISELLNNMGSDLKNYEELVCDIKYNYTTNVKVVLVSQILSFFKK